MLYHIYYGAVERKMVGGGDEVILSEFHWRVEGEVYEREGSIHQFRRKKYYAATNIKMLTTM